MPSPVPPAAPRRIPGARRRPWAAVLPVVLALALLAPAGAGAQALVSPQLRAEAGRLFRELAQLRGHPAGEPPPRVVVRTREERRRFIVSELNRRYPASRLEAERRAMIAWGLIPADFNLTGFLTDLVLEQAAAYYDPVGRVMVLASWLGPEEQREALAHELVHALQDRQMNLDRFLASGPGQSDRALARQALVEGEAVALTLDLSLRRQGSMLALLPDVAERRSAILRSATGPMLSRAPRFLRTLLIFPYAHGLAFVHRVLQQRPWSAFPALYRDPPRASAQILHPERYLDQREDPAALTLPDLGPVLGPGSRPVIEDEIGEVVLAEILGITGDAPVVPGWAGDRYALWEDAAGTPILVALTAWTTDSAADAFARLYVARLTRKHGRGPDPGSPLTWRRAGRADGLETRGRAVVAVEGAPETALQPLLRALSGPGR